MQLGGVRSTSQVAKSFMGTGLIPEADEEADNKPAMLKLPRFEAEVNMLLPEVKFWPPAAKELDPVVTDTELLTGMVKEAAVEAVGGPGGRKPLTALAILRALKQTSL